MLFSSTQAKIGYFVSLALVSLSALLTPRAYSQELSDCPISPLVPISGIATEYLDPSLGFKFEFPSNYIVSEKVDPYVRLFYISNPSIHNHIECMKQNQVQTTFFSGVAVAVYEENLEGKDLNAYLLSRASALPPPQISGARYIDEIPRTVTILNQPGVYYSTRHPDGAAYILAFISQDKTLIEISTPYIWRDQKPVALFEKEVFDQVINSFTFISETSGPPPDDSSSDPSDTPCPWISWFKMSEHPYSSLSSIKDPFAPATPQENRRNTEIKEDYHYYTVGTPICSTADPNCTRANVFQAMTSRRKFVAPVEEDPDAPVLHCIIVSLLESPNGIHWLQIPLAEAGDILYENNVITLVNEEQFTVINYTLITPADSLNEFPVDLLHPQRHVFHPGRIIRSVFEKNGIISVFTEGEGTGAFRDINVAGGEKIFQNIDQKLKDYFVSQSSDANPAVAGNYSSQDGRLTANLADISKEKFSFSLSIDPGDCLGCESTNSCLTCKCLGGVAGTANWVNKNTAMFNTNEGGRECEIVFKFTGSALTINEDNCGVFHGASCGFWGELIKKN